MKPTDTSEKELERLIVRHLAGISEHPPAPANTVQEPISASIHCCQAARARRQVAHLY